MLAVVGSNAKIARLVANMIANKLYFKPTQNLRTLKRRVRLLAIDHRSKVTKSIRIAPFSTFKDLWLSLSFADKYFLTRVLNFSRIGTKESTQWLIFKKESENRAIDL